MTSLTGPNYMGLENRDGADLAVEQLNDAGGVLGRRVELMAEDDESLPQGAVASTAFSIRGGWIHRDQADRRGRRSGLR